MGRNTDLAEILFPVEMEDVFFERKNPDGDQIKFSIPKYKAVVNKKTEQTYAVVSENYRLIKNDEAIELAKQCFKQLFNTADTSEMEIFNIIAPSTKSYCHVDIIHKKYTVNVWEKEVWLPYIRVTNSYNRTRALRFDLGFCRKLCDNGVIFEKETIEVKYYHTKQELKITDAGFDVDFKKLKSLEMKFLEYMNNLKRYHVPEKYALPAICKALAIGFDITSEDRKKRDRELRRFDEFQFKGGKLVKKYYEEHGPTAYALLNIISDIASRPIINAGPGIMIDTYQKRTGEWIDYFISEIEQKSFSFEDYLGETFLLFNPPTN